MNLTEKQNKLLEFVKEQHGDQIRKYVGTPYWTHTYEVAEIVSEFVDGTIEIAFCHDLLEDTDCTQGLLLSELLEIGYEYEEAMDIVVGVVELTDVFTHEAYPQFNRKTRKELEAERLSKISVKAQSIKYADLIHNTGSIVEFDKDFAVTYLKEKKYMLNKMRLGNIDLLAKCFHTLQNAEKDLAFSK